MLAKNEVNKHIWDQVYANNSSIEFDLVFLVFPEDSEKRLEAWTGILAKFKMKMLAVRRNLRVNEA